MATRKKRLKRVFKKNFPLFLMVFPGLVYLLFNNYLPMFGLVMAFKNVNMSKGILGSDWCGLENFEYLFGSSDAWIITRNTLLYNISFIVLNTVLGVVFCILLSEIKNHFFERMYQSVILVPYLISAVIIGYIVYAFLNGDNGFVNRYILPLLGKEAISWYSAPAYWPFILAFVNSWKNVGYYSIIFYSALIGIDTSLFEAASIDGANWWQRTTRVTIPMLSPIITTMFLLQVGKIFYADFGLFYQVTLDSGILYPTTNVIDTYVYRTFLQIGDMGMSSAAGFYQSVVGFVIVLLANFAVKKIDSEKALF